MIKIICHGYKNADGQTVPCGKALGEKEGGDGESHTYCDDCFKKQIDASMEYMEMTGKGTLDNGDSKSMKVARVRAIVQGNLAYETES